MTLCDRLGRGLSIEGLTQRQTNYLPYIYLTAMGILEKAVELICMSPGCERKPKGPRGIPCSNNLQTQQVNNLFANHCTADIEMVYKRHD